MFISDCLIYLFTDWLGGLALRLKDQNVNPLWTDLICSNFFDCLVNFISSGMCKLFIRFFIFIFIIPVFNYLWRLFRKSRNNLFNSSTDNGRNWLVSSWKCTSRKVERNGNFFFRYIIVKLFQCFILFWSFWTQYTSNFLSCSNLQNNKI